MVTVYPYEKLGHAHHGWLDTRYHFSFANYMNPRRMGFGALRVINDDRVAAGHGFDAHPHENMEIVTFVRQGAISHQDSLGNSGKTKAGDVQVMSAGSGIVHEEHNLEKEETRLYQIWIIPNKEDVAPYWEAREFPKDYAVELKLLVSGRPEDKDKGALFIYQDAAIWGGNLKAGQALEQAIKHQAYVLVSKGEITLNGKAMKEGDGAEVTGENTLKISAKTEAQVLVIDVPAE